MKKTMKKVLALVMTVLMCVSVVLPVVAADVTCPGADKDHYKTNCAYTEIDKVEAACGTDGYTLYQCNHCDKYFADDIVEAAQQHEAKDGATVAPSCGQQGYKVCKHCNEKFDIVEGSGKGHAYAPFTDENKANGTWYPVAEDEDCNYTKWETVCLHKVGYTDEDGITYTWNCDATTQKDYDGDLDNHEWKLVVDDKFVAPTCSETGSGTFKCEVCDTVKTLVIEATGNHTYTVPVEYKAQTCTEDGNEECYACDQCGAIPPEAVLTALHDVDLKGGLDGGPDGFADCFEISVGTDATCTTAGYSVVYCSKCDYELPQIIRPLGHEGRGEIIETVGATCATAGYIQYEHACTRPGCPVNAEGGDSSRDILEQEDACVYVFRKYNPTCEDDGYSQYECKWCGDLKPGTEPTIDEDSASEEWHVWDEGSIYTHPSCTTPGYKAVTCTECGETKDGVIVPANGHNFFVKDDDGNVVYLEGTDIKQWADTNEPVITAPHCSAEGGVNGYRTYECTECDATTKEYNDDLKFNEGVLGYHDSLRGDDVNPIKVVDGSCTVAGYSQYFCGTCAKLVKIYDTTPGQNGNHAKPAEGHANYYGAYDAPTCDDPNTEDDDEDAKGYAEFWKCTACDYVEGALKNAKGELVDADGELTDTPVRIVYPALTHENLVAGKAPTCTEDGYLATWDCSECETKFTSEDEGYVLPKLNHTLPNGASAWGNGDDAFDFSEAKFSETNTDCLTHSYAHYVCALCKADMIADYHFEEHEWLDTVIPATCEKYSYKECKDCDAELEIDPKLGHIDEEGNVIKCATEDNFKCYRDCCADEDADTACNANIDSWKTTHNFAVTKIAATCVAFDYTLYTCVDCEFHYTENGFTKLDHNHVFYRTVSNPSYTAEGLDEWKCVCGDIKPVATKKTDVQFTFTTGNANGANAAVVNSGLIALTVKTSAYKLPIWGFDLSIAFDNTLVKFESFEVHNADFKATTKVAAKNTTGNATADAVTISAYAPNDANGKLQNIELNGDKVAFVTVYFRVLDNTIGATAKFATQTNVIRVTNKDAENVAVNTSALTIADVAIKALGDVNGDIAVTNTSVGNATIVDAVALMNIIEDGGYNAMADVDKNGKIEVADFNNLMKYIAGEMTYAQLCALR